MTLPAPTLRWQRQPGIGWYIADCDGTTGVLRWMIVRTADRRWEIVSIRADFERRRHGAAYTLREARATVDRWHAADTLLAVTA